MTGKDTMKKFRNILFVSNALQDETAAMKQALSLSRNNEATLKALLVCPGLPNSLDEYAAKYKEALTEQLAESICKAQAALKMEEKADSIPVVIESGSTPAIRIIRHVLRDSCDLVVKDAQPSLDGKGFMAVDMDLLNSCENAPALFGCAAPLNKQETRLRLPLPLMPKAWIEQAMIWLYSFCRFPGRWPTRAAASLILFPAGILNSKSTYITIHGRAFQKSRYPKRSPKPSPEIRTNLRD